MKQPNVTLNVRVAPEVAITLTKEAEHRSVRSVNTLVAQILADWVAAAGGQHE